MSATTAPLRIALLGNPNCGKTALFNLLTGSRQKVANYAGVTVERKEGLLTTPQGRPVRVLDLPGAYSLNAMSADEAVTRDIMTGQRAQDPQPDLVVCVVDATNLKLNLCLVLEARALGLPMVLAPWRASQASWWTASCWRVNSTCRWWRPWVCSTTARAPCWSSWTDCRRNPMPRRFRVAPGKPPRWSR